MVDCYIGEIRLFAGTRLPQGWHACDGTLLQIQSNQALFSLIGITYGGDGKVTFGLPDLRSRVPIGQGTGAGLTLRQIGTSGGEENVTLASTQAPAHTHGLFVSQAPANSPFPEGAMPGTLSGGMVFYAPPGSPVTAPVELDPDVIGPIGGEPHPNLMPSQAVNYMIALTGTYPPRSN